MLLDEIKKNCKIVVNEEKQGEELYFNEKPTAELIATLKENCYKWHNGKKCWYRKLEYTGKTRETKQTKNNYLGVKVGDIFHYSWRIRTNERKLFPSGSPKGYKTSNYQGNSIHNSRNNRI